MELYAYKCYVADTTLPALNELGVQSSSAPIPSVCTHDGLSQHILTSPQPFRTFMDTFATDPRFPTVKFSGVRRARSRPSPPASGCFAIIAPYTTRMGNL